MASRIRLDTVLFVRPTLIYTHTHLSLTEKIEVRDKDIPVSELSPTSTLCYSTVSLHTGVSPLLASVDLNSEDPSKIAQNENAMHTGLTSKISGLKFHEKRRSEVFSFEGKYFIRMLY